VKIKNNVPCFVLLIIFFVLIMIGCTKNNTLDATDSPTISNTDTPQPISSASDLPKGYLSIQNGEIYFLSWTSSDKSISGPLIRILYSYEEVKMFYLGLFFHP
jgi:hypothetical protein